MFLAIFAAIFLIVAVVLGIAAVRMSAAVNGDGSDYDRQDAAGVRMWLRISAADTGPPARATGAITPSAATAPRTDFHSFITLSPCGF